MKLKFLPFLGVLAAGPTVAAGTATPELLLQLIRENGCQMTFVEADQILPENGFEQAQVRDIVREWEGKGMLDARGFAGIALSEKGCKG